MEYHIIADQKAIFIQKDNQAQTHCCNGKGIRKRLTAAGSTIVYPNHEFHGLGKTGRFRLLVL
jgi:hypothetical protein